MAWIAGRKGIKFQNKSGEIVLRSPGQPVPEADGFKNRRILILAGMLKWVDDKGIATTENTSTLLRSEQKAIAVDAKHDAYIEKFNNRGTEAAKKEEVLPQDEQGLPKSTNVTVKRKTRTSRRNRKGR